MGRKTSKSKLPIEQRPVSISVASVLTGVETHTLRYWEKEFAEFLSPNRTEGGQRRYTREDISVITEIKRLLKDELYSIAGAKRALRRHLDDEDDPSSEHGSGSRRSHPEKKMTRDLMQAGH
ncbi:MAG: MerR family transcriptional regulator [Fimbriimonadia bacterium]|nr:MerR family transcriptional regulator [Fimbriimonadia bacterium]